MCLILSQAQNTDETFPPVNCMARAPTESVSATIEALVKALTKAYNVLDGASSGRCQHPCWGLACRSLLASQ
jgi:hypothetical protein